MGAGDPDAELVDRPARRAPAVYDRDDIERKIARFDRRGPLGARFERHAISPHR